MRKSIDNINIGIIYENMLNEDMSSGDVFGGEPIPNEIENGDDYAPGDARVPAVLGIYSRKGKVKKKKRAIRPKRPYNCTNDIMTLKA